MSSPPEEKKGATLTNGMSKDAAPKTSQPGAAAPAPSSSSSENRLPSFQSEASEGTLNPKLLGMQPTSGPLPRGHAARQAPQSSFKMPTSSQPSLPALTPATASSMDSAAGPPQQNGINHNAALPQSQPLSNSNGSQQGQQQHLGTSGNLPAMHLFPLNDTFIPKCIHLPPQVRIKVGRQTNTKSVPAANNGYFDSKVLSRTHAEVWFDTDSPAGPGVFIKDVGSSNGTFINGERLSAEGMKSDVFQLREGDVVEFGIDIASEDNKTILHHKVAAKVALALTPEDAERIAKSPAASNSFAAVRRMSRAPGMASSGMSFDHILQRLQSELQRSRDAGSDLQAASLTMHKAHEAIHGNLPPPSMPSYPHTLPPVAPPQQNFTAVQSQLSETQASLTAHSDRVKSLEETITSLKDEVERTKSEMEVMLASKSHELSNGHSHEDDNDDDVDTRSDAGSIASVETARFLTEDHDRALREEQDSLRTANAALLTRIEQLSSELQQANSISAELTTQHQSQASVLDAIQGRLARLEEISQDRPIARQEPSTVDAMEQRWNAWKTTFEASWQEERASWQEERSRLEAKIAELEAKSSQQPPRRRRKSRRRRDDDGSTSTSGSSDAERSMARASTPSSVASAGVALSGSEAGPSSPRKGESSLSSQETAVGEEPQRDVATPSGHSGSSAVSGSKGKRDKHSVSTTAAAGALGCVTVAVIAYLAAAAATGQAPKD